MAAHSTASHSTAAHSLGVPTARAPVLEVFRSIQGEGLHLGEPQVFVRTRGCPLRCRYCDTPQSWMLRKGQSASIAAESLAIDGREEAAWASPFQVALWVAEAEAGGPRLTVSWTGGEPLQWPSFAREFARLLGGRRLHLETGGGHPRTLGSLLGLFHHVSLDLKLPSDLDAPVNVELDHSDEDGAGAQPSDEPSPHDADSWRAARRACLDLVAGRDACAKLVVTADSSEREAFEAIDDVAELASDLPLFLQPASPMPRAAAPRLEQLRTLWEYALEQGLAPRVVPQVHRALNLR